MCSLFYKLFINTSKVMNAVIEKKDNWFFNVDLKHETESDDFQTLTMAPDFEQRFYYYCRNHISLELLTQVKCDFIRMYLCIITHDRCINFAHQLKRTTPQVLNWKNRKIRTWGTELQSPKSIRWNNLVIQKYVICYWFFFQRAEFLIEVPER